MSVTKVSRRSAIGNRLMACATSRRLLWAGASCSSYAVLALAVVLAMPAGAALAAALAPTATGNLLVLPYHDRD